MGKLSLPNAVLIYLDLKYFCNLNTHVITLQRLRIPEVVVVIITI